MIDLFSAIGNRGREQANGFVSQWSEEGTYIFDQCLWLFQCCEVTPNWHLCPTLNIVEALGKEARRNRDFCREHSNTSRHLDSPRNGFTLVSRLVVEACGGVDGLGDPIDHDICEQFIFCEDALDLTMTITTEKYRSTGISGNYADLARALGGYGERVTEPGEITPAIQRAIRQTQEGTPALLEFLTQKEQTVSTFR